MTNTRQKGKALITDANSRRSLATIRSLGKRGIFVIAGHDQPKALSFASKYCRGRLIYPNPRNFPEEFLAYILKHLSSESYDCFLPMGDETMRVSACHAEELSRLTNLLVVDSSTLNLTLDKWKTIEFARSHGFACPQTFLIEDLQSIGLLRKQISYPAVIKPRMESGARGVVFIERPEDLWPLYLRVHRHYPFPLIQEAVSPSSPKFGVQCLFNRQGSLRAAYVQRFWRQYPLKGGPGSCFETVNRPDILAQGVRLLELLNWKGVAQVEFLEDTKDGVLKLMEINPRFWDSLQTVIQANMDFPYLLYTIATRGDVESHMDYKFGKVCRSVLPGEILYVLAKGKRSSSGPSYWRIRGSNLDHCIWNREDIRPFFAFFSIALQNLLSREIRDLVFHRL